jgi:hypothetical protein
LVDASISEEYTATLFRVEDPNLFFDPSSVINLVLYEYALCNLLVVHSSFTKNLICRVLYSQAESSVVLKLGLFYKREIQLAVV